MPLLNRLRVEYGIAKLSTELLVPTELNSITWVSEVKGIRNNELPLTAAYSPHAPRSDALPLEPACALAAEALTLEHTLSDLVNQAYALTPAEITLLWQTAPHACSAAGHMILSQSLRDWAAREAGLDGPSRARTARNSDQ
jgi:hypothetical protein